jgi:hypothetical protein
MTDNRQRQAPPPLYSMCCIFTTPYLRTIAPQPPN